MLPFASRTIIPEHCGNADKQQNKQVVLNVKGTTRIPTNYPSTNYRFWWFGTTAPGDVAFFTIGRWRRAIGAGAEQADPSSAPLFFEPKRKRIVTSTLGTGLMGT